MQDAHKDLYQRRLWIGGMIRPMIGKFSFLDAYNEDLNNVRSVFDTFADMCKITAEEKRQSIPLMLIGNSLSLFARNGKDFETYEQAAELLQSWYKSTKKQSRLLSKWQAMKLTTAMHEKTNDSEIEFFRLFVARLMDVQKQLDKSYHGDQYVLDMFSTAVNIDTIRDTLRDRVPSISHQLSNRVETRLSNKPPTPGTVEDNWAINKPG